MREGRPKIYKKRGTGALGAGQKKTGWARGPSRLEENQYANEYVGGQSSWMSSLMSDVTRLMISLANATIWRGS